MSNVWWIGKHRMHCFRILRRQGFANGTAGQVSGLDEVVKKGLNSLESYRGDTHLDRKAQNPGA